MRVGECHKCMSHMQPAPAGTNLGTYSLTMEELNTNGWIKSYMAIAEITKGGREGGGKGRVEKYGTEQRQVKTQIPTCPLASQLLSPVCLPAVLREKKYCRKSK